MIVLLVEPMAVWQNIIKKTLFTIGVINSGCPCTMQYSEQYELVKFGHLGLFSWKISCLEGKLRIKMSRVACPTQAQYLTGIVYRKDKYFKINCGD